MTLLIIIVFIICFTTFHTPKIVLFLQHWLVTLKVYFLLFMIKTTCVIWIDIHDLAVYTITFLTVVAPFRALLVSFAELTAGNCIFWIFIYQIVSTGALSIYISYNFFRFWLIKLLWQMRIASLAYSKIAMTVVINPVVTDRCTNAANITNVI